MKKLHFIVSSLICNSVWSFFIKIRNNIKIASLTYFGLLYNILLNLNFFILMRQNQKLYLPENNS